MEATQPADRGIPPGLVPNMPEEDYHQAPAVSRSALKTILRKTPAHHKHLTQKSTEALTMGSLTDCALLEPELLYQRFMPYAKGTRRTHGGKPTKAWEELQETAGSRVLVTQDDMDGALKLADAALNHPIVGGLLQGHASQPSAFWRDAETGLLCKCRPDAWREDIRVMIDIKTIADASALRLVDRAVYEYGYYLQDAWYRHGWAAAGGAIVDMFLFVFIDKAGLDSDHPERFIRCMELDGDWRAKGREDNRMALSEFKRCLDEGQWPGYSPHIEPLTMPNWVKTA